MPKVQRSHTPSLPSGPMGIRRRPSLINRIAQAAAQHSSKADALDRTRIEDHIKQLLGGLRADHLNLNPKALNLEPGKIFVVDIFECSLFAINVFILAKGATIPLHDHPGMSVMSKVLWGSCHITSLDWLPDETDLPAQARRAVVVGNSEMHADTEPRMLLPTTNGNIHEIFSPEFAILFDILLPPYSDEDGRDCTYFRIDGEVEQPRITPSASKSETLELPPSPSHSNSGDLSASEGSPQLLEEGAPHSPPRSPNCSRLASLRSTSTEALAPAPLQSLPIGAKVSLVQHEPYFNSFSLGYNGPPVDGCLAGSS